MEKLNLGFSKYSDANLLVLSQSSQASLVGNVNFPTTSPTVAEYQTDINAFSTALSAAKDRSRDNVADKNAARTTLINTMVSLGMDLMKQANGNLQALISTGFPVSKPRQPLPPLEKPQVMKMEDGVNSGELLVTIAYLLGARTLIFQYTEDPLTADSVWHSQNTTTVKMLLTGLEPGKRYWIRVIAYGTNEQEVFSDAILSPIIR